MDKGRSVAVWQRSRVGQQTESPGVEDDEPHETNRGRFDNRSSSTTLIR